MQVIIWGPCRFMSPWRFEHRAQELTLCAGLLSREQLIEAMYGLASQSAYGPAKKSLSENLNWVDWESLSSNGKNSSQSLEQGFKDAIFPPSFMGIIVLIEADKVIGFLLARQVFEIAEVDFVCVDGSRRNAGIGKELMCLFEQCAILSRANRLLLEVGACNDIARRLYEKCGFSEISRRQDYYRGQEAALVMEKNL